MSKELFVVWRDNGMEYIDHDESIVCICETMEDAKKITFDDYENYPNGFISIQIIKKSDKNYIG